MIDLQKHWNTSSATIPEDKDPSAYALEKEKLFPRGATICDLGGGSGVDALYFASQGHSVKLVDISDMGLAQATAAAAERNLGQSLKTFQCNMGDGTLPLPDNSCDVVYSRLALHYFSSEVLTSLFREIYRMLKPGGKAYLTVKSPDDSAEMEYLGRTATMKEEGVFEEKGLLKTRFTLQQLSNMLLTAGLDEQEFKAGAYTENLDDRKDRVKSGNMQLLLNEVQITKNRS